MLKYTPNVTIVQVWLHTFAVALKLAAVRLPILVCSSHYHCSRYGSRSRVFMVSIESWCSVMSTYDITTHNLGVINY